MIQVARLHLRPLDRAHPAVEATNRGSDNIPKLPPGAFAVFLKIHHAIVDGMAAVHLTRQMHDRTPERVPADETPRVVVGDREPSPYEFLSRSLANQVERAGKWRGWPARSGPRAGRGREHLPQIAEGDLSGIARKISRCGAACRARRRASVRRSPPIAWSKVRHAVLAHPAHPRQGAGKPTLNDVFIAVAGCGAPLPFVEGRAAGPVADRADADLAEQRRVRGRQRRRRRAGQRLLDVADPIERLRAAHLRPRPGSSRVRRWASIS